MLFRASSDGICRLLNGTVALRQFCCPVSLISALSSANIPVSPRFFGEFDVLAFAARHFEKPLIPSSAQPTRKPPKPLGRKRLGRC